MQSSPPASCPDRRDAKTQTPFEIWAPSNHSPVPFPLFPIASISLLTICVLFVNSDPAQLTAVSVSLPRSSYTKNVRLTSTPPRGDWRLFYRGLFVMKDGVYNKVVKCYLHCNAKHRSCVRGAAGKLSPYSALQGEMAQGRPGGEQRDVKTPAGQQTSPHPSRGTRAGTFVRGRTRDGRTV